MKRPVYWNCQKWNSRCNIDDMFVVTCTDCAPASNIGCSLSFFVLLGL